MASLTKLRGAVVALVLVAGVAACTGPDASEQTGGESEAGPDASTRVVEHALGTTEIPVDPQRIVVLDSAYLVDNLTALGLGDRIVGRVDLNGIGDVEPAWLTDDLDFSQITYLGSLYPDGVDVEQLAALEPDLVIGLGSAFGDQYEQISSFTAAVAPVMAEGYVVGAWQDLTLATGEVLGLADEAQALVEGVEAHLADRVAALPDGLDDRSLTTLGGWTGDPTLYYSGSIDSTWIFDAAGFELNPGFPDSTYEMLAPEMYPQLDSDVISIADFGFGAIDYKELFASDGVLATLPATASDQVIVVDGLLLTSAGPLGMPDAIDAVYDQLVAQWQE